MFYYGVNLVDVVEGEGPPPDLVWELVRGLPEDSMTSALRQGGMQFMGWNTERYLLAGIFDAVQANTYATGQWKKRPAEPKPFPRPTNAVATKKKDVSVAALFASMTQAQEKGGLGHG